MEIEQGLSQARRGRSPIRVRGGFNSVPIAFCTGFERLVRIYDLEKPEVEPEILQETPDRVRGVAYLQDDKLLLTSYIDKPGLG